MPPTPSHAPRGGGATARAPARPAAPPPRRRAAAAPPPPRRGRAPALRVAAIMGVDTFLPALGLRPEDAVLTSAALAAGGVIFNLYSGVALEQRRAALALALERERARQATLRELQGVVARYRGPLLESAIDLEQRLFHLVADAGRAPATAAADSCRYLLFTLGQWLGLIEVVRREGPRERPFLSTGGPQGADSLSTLVEGMRFVLCAEPELLQEWHDAGTGPAGAGRPHPGLRRRRSREELIAAAAAAAAASCDSEEDDCPFDPAPLLFVGRGYQRAIGASMIVTPLGAARHYTMGYAAFVDRLESDPSFARWFERSEAAMLDAVAGAPWDGAGPFPCSRWTRVLLLQQLLVELMGLLDPDGVRLPAARRNALAPLPWGPLPRVEEYHAQLRALNELDVAVPPEVAAAAARGSGAGGNVAPAPWSPWPWGGEARVDVAASELGELEREMLKR